jgi:hypothetical protein
VRHGTPGWLLLLALFAARPDAAQAQAELADPHAMTTVVVRFYAALERSDFKAANTYVVPESRERGRSTFDASSYYSRHSELRFEGMVPASRNSILARYRYQSVLGKHCEGNSLVTLRQSNNTWLIEKISPSDRC